MTKFIVFDYSETIPTPEYSRKEVEKALDELRKISEEFAIPLIITPSDADRFLAHLNTIAHRLNIDWWDGDFPIQDFLDKIDEYEKNM